MHSLHPKQNKLAVFWNRISWLGIKQLPFLSMIWNHRVAQGFRNQPSAKSSISCGNLKGFISCWKNINFFQLHLTTKSLSEVTWIRDASRHPMILPSRSLAAKHWLSCCIILLMAEIPRSPVEVGSLSCYTSQMVVVWDFFHQQ